MARGDADDGGLEILSKAGAIIDALAATPQLSAAGLAEAVGEPTSSTYRLLQSLTALGWVDPAPTRGAYRLGLGLMSTGASVEASLDVRGLALPRMRALRAEADLAVLLCYRKGLRAVCVERLEGHDVTSVAMQVADSLPLHRGAAPLALLAHLPAGERSAVVEQLADPLLTRPDDPADVEALTAELAAIRERGYARSDQDVTVGIAALGSPVLNHRGEMVAALSVSGLRERVIDQEEHVSALVTAAAAAISGDLGHGGTQGIGGDDG
ncbi:IclR family transcriptional regulator [Brachybacterium sp. AOP43-C2-M15]|uniref:IclR family transcriptional regulator n=1 Tax=Brachybacterium sp. AOP43-C2-M15 TaxID=3457661 RepID=UPI004034C796